MADVESTRLHIATIFDDVCLEYLTISVTNMHHVSR